MGFFKKSFQKNVTRNNEFLKDYAIKCNGLALYVEENEKVLKELNALKDDFQYTVATNIRDAKGLEKKIKKDFERLTNMLEQTDCDEGEVIMTIRAIRRSITEISSMR